MIYVGGVKWYCNVVVFVDGNKFFGIVCFFEFFMDDMLFCCF